jgi:hypothetical protein
MCWPGLCSVLASDSVVWSGPGCTGTLDWRLRDVTVVWVIRRVTCKTHMYWWQACIRRPPPPNPSPHAPSHVPHVLPPAHPARPSRPPIPPTHPAHPSRPPIPPTHPAHPPNPPPPTSSAQTRTTSAKPPGHRPGALSLDCRSLSC